MTALHLLHDLREAGVTFAPEAGGVLVLTLPTALVLRALPVPGRPWAIGLYSLAQEFDDYTHVLLDCARMPWAEAEALAWRLVLAGYAAPGA